MSCCWPIDGLLPAPAPPLGFRPWASADMLHVRRAASTTETNIERIMIYSNKDRLTYYHARNSPWMLLSRIADNQTMNPSSDCYTASKFLASYAKSTPRRLFMSDSKGVRKMPAFFAREKK
jgi:hypothetical protein